MKKGYITPMKTPCKSKAINKESIQVYCRLKPLPSPSDTSCIKVISDTSVQLTVQDANNLKNTCRQYTFKRIFTEANTQKELFDDVALPLVDQLIKGRNGLLFTYGVTGSGKTYTMTGNKQEVGIMPRCLDVLFNSINDYQAKKYVFKPDRLNGFEVQTEDEAERDREDSLRKTLMSSRLRKKGSQEDLNSARSKDGTKITVTEEDNAFAVFITYIEVYNNYVFDLLDNHFESDICSKPQSKFIREDGTGNMYIHGITEVEVKSTEEAFEMFYKGQRRKKMEHTSLNRDSSRSHSIFSIRLVQAPLDMNGENVIQDKKVISISQLSLVDLAGSERANRTKNTGQRLNEAGKINQSLMALRKCLETVRENQQTGANKMVPYREQKITHLFKNYFEGDGEIRMIVCVNPSIADSDENLLVMQFAEASQDIMIKQTPMKVDPGFGLTPGRRRINQGYKKAIQMMEEIKEKEFVAHVPVDADVIYSLEPFPSFNASEIDNIDEFIQYNKKLQTFLEERIKKKSMLEKDLTERTYEVRKLLLDEKKIKDSLKLECDTNYARFENVERKCKTLEDKLLAYDRNESSLKRKLEEITEECKRLKRDNEIKDSIIQRYNMEKDQEKKNIRKVIAKNEKLAREKENNLKEKKNIEIQLKDKDRQLRRVRKVLETENDFGKKKFPKTDFDSDTEIESTSPSTNGNEAPVIETPTSQNRIRSPTKSVQSIPISNSRYGNSCDTHSLWLDHRANVLAPLNTVMRPVLKKRKSFTKITSPEEVRKNSKYCLMTQNQDEDGALETQLYKGDIVPSPGGGAHVVFNDMETLKQTSPVSLPISPKTKSTGIYPDLESRCSVSVEGHGSKRK